MVVRLIHMVVGLACAFFFLALSLYRVHLGAVGAATANARPFWIGAAMLTSAVNLALRSRRWQIILRPVAARFSGPNSSNGARDFPSCGHYIHRH